MAGAGARLRLAGQEIQPRRPARPAALPGAAGPLARGGGILVFAWVELVYASGEDPSTLAVLALAYAAVQLVGMSLYGVEAWTRNGDASASTSACSPALAAALGAGRRCTSRPPLAG